MDFPLWSWTFRQNSTLGSNKGNFLACPWSFTQVTAPSVVGPEGTILIISSGLLQSTGKRTSPGTPELGSDTDQAAGIVTVAPTCNTHSTQELHEKWGLSWFRYLQGSSGLMLSF